MNSQKLYQYWVWGLAWCLGSLLSGQSVGGLPIAQGPYADLVRPALLVEQSQVTPGSQTWVALQLQIKPGWHVYWKNYGDTGGNIHVDWQLPEGFSAGEMEYPTPHWILTRGIIVSYGHEGELVLLVPLQVADTVSHGTYTLQSQVEWYVCEEEECIAGKARLTATIQVGSERVTNDSVAKIFKRAIQQLPPQEVHTDIRFVVQNGKPSLRLPASLINGAKPVTHYMPPHYPVYFFPESPVIAPRSIQAPVVHGEEAVLTMDWESGGRNSRRLQGLLVVGKPSNGHPYTIYRVDAPREEDAAVSSYTEENVTATTKGEDDGTNSWQQRWQGREAQLPGLGSTHGFVTLGGGNEEITGMGMALVLAFLGGLILNVMPCVFPVLGLKVMGFVKQAGGDPVKIRWHGVVFTLGVVFSFWVLVGILLILRSTLDTSLGWGFQMQDPFFIALVVMLFFFFGLSLSGVFEFGSSFMSLGGSAQSREGYTGSLFSGVFATLVATPCVGPFLGPVLGFTLTLEIYAVILVFTFMALGLASPYLLSAFFPKILALLPKPGGWMETFKQWLAFPMYVAAIYFLWSFGKQTASVDHVVGFLVALWLLAMAAWVWGRWAVPSRRRTVRRLGLLTAWLMIVGAVILAWRVSQVDPQRVAESSRYEQQNTTYGEWIPFSPEALELAQQQGKAVYVDFTAAWCAVCQANKLIAFEGPGSDQVWQAIHDLDVVMMRADWTSKDPVIYHYLQSFGRAGVPLNVLYLPTYQSEKPIVLPSLLFPDTVLQALERIE